MEALKGHTIIIFPDIDGTAKWREKAAAIRGCKVIISDILERHATPEEREAKIDLADWIIKSRKDCCGDENTDKQKIDVKYILADVLESFLCAIYYEFDIDKVYQLVETLFTKHMTSADAIDPKMQLQEMTQKKYKTLPTYSLVTKEGSEHEPMFKVAVSCGDLYAEGTGKNKKNAEKQAAKNMLNLLQINKKA